LIAVQGTYAGVKSAAYQHPAGKLVFALALTPDEMRKAVRVRSSALSESAVWKDRQTRVSEVYEVRDLDTVVRCPGCDNALVRLAHNRGRTWIDLRGIRYLQVEDVVG
jgi:hypothetical protein